MYYLSPSVTLKILETDYRVFFKITDQTEIFFLNYMNWFFFILTMQYAFCEIGAEYLLFRWISTIVMEFPLC
jgi:hypothetical protein